VYDFFSFYRKNSGEKLKPIVQTVNELKDSLQFLSDKYDSVNKRVDELESKYNSVQQENKFLRAEILKPLKLVTISIKMLTQSNIIL
jgi:peptidoglycan hydrolase CwlO-like protein